MGWTKVIAACIAAGGVLDVAAAARASGLSPQWIRERACRDDWWHPYPSVIGLPGIRLDGEAWARAAVLHARGGTGDPECDLAALTRGSALALLGVQRSFPTRAEVVIPATRRVVSARRLAVVRSRVLRPHEVGERDGVPIVVGPALLRDLAPVRTRAALRDAAIDLAKAGVVDLDELPPFLASQPTFAGKPLLRQVATDILGAGRTDSPFELQVRERLAGEGIVLDRGQVPLPGTRIHLDLGIRAVRFGIELNSLAFHASRLELDRDAARANAIASLDADWRVLHATWSVLTAGWDTFVAQVREVVAAQSRRHLGVPWPRAGDVQT